MKICDNCGASNSDKRRICIDCGETLGEKLTKKQEKEYRQGVSDKIERLYNKTDPLYVSVFDKIIGVISLVGIFASIALIIMLLIKDKTSEIILFGLVGFVAAAVEAFFPRCNWAIEKRRLSWYINGADDIQPGVFYFWGRKISMVVFLVFGIIVLTFDIISNK